MGWDFWGKGDLGSYGARQWALAFGTGTPSGNLGGELTTPRALAVQADATAEADVLWVTHDTGTTWTRVCAVGTTLAAAQVTLGLPATLPGHAISLAEAQALFAGVPATQPAVLDYTNTPPVGPADGDRYLTEDAPTGAWAGHPHELAVWSTGLGAWQFTVPTVGYQYPVTATGAIWLWTGVDFFNIGAVPAHDSTTGILSDALPPWHLSPAQHTGLTGGSATTLHRHAQAVSHESPDTDAATTSLHHTIGTGATQAAPGTHPGEAAPHSGHLTSFQGRVTQAAVLTKADVTGTGLSPADIAAVATADTTATPTASKIPIAGLGGKLAAGWIPTGTASLSVDASVQTSLPQIPSGATIRFYGGFVALATAQPLAAGTPINVANGTSRLIVVPKAGADFAGTITVTGTSVDRHTGATTPGDSETITVDALATDTSTADANGVTKIAITGAYMTAKWYMGAVALSTADLTLTSVDVWQVAYYQFKDSAGITLEGFDLTGTPKNANSWYSAYLYSLAYVAGTKKLSLTVVAEEVRAAGTLTASRVVRSKHNGLAISVDGSAGSGCWLTVSFGRPAQQDWDQVTVAILASKAITGSVTF
jgi:hypothetical protein